MATVTFDGEAYTVGQPGTAGTVVGTVGPVEVTVTYDWGTAPSMAGVAFYLVYGIAVTTTGSQLYQGCLPVSVGQLIFNWPNTSGIVLTVAWGAAYITRLGVVETILGQTVQIDAGAPNMTLNIPTITTEPSLSEAAGSPIQITPGPS